MESEPPYAYVRGNPINFSDPSGYIKESETGDADRILEELERIYKVTITKDWGYKWTWQYLIIPTCTWNEGEWTIDEMGILRTGVASLGVAMGGSHRFVANIGGITVSQEPINSLGLTGAHQMKLNNQRPFGKWTVVHELGHAWDANFGWHLSIGLEDFTGGYTDPKNKPTNCDADQRLPGCNKAGYFYSGVPPAGSGSTFTRREDFAESVAAYVYPSVAQSRIKKFEFDPNYRDLLYYSDYTKTLRWVYIDLLINGSNKKHHGTIE